METNFDFSPFLDCIRNFPSQDAIFNHPARFKIVPKGRRYGLTMGKAHHLMHQAYGHHFRQALWVDTAYKNIDRYVAYFFLPCLRLLDKDAYRWHKTAGQLQIFEAVIDFRSADRPKNMEGFAYDEVFLNEAGIILKDDYLWDHAIRPMLMDHHSPALIAGTPKGMNRFEKIYQYALQYMAEHPHGTEYQVFHRTSLHNPIISLTEIEQMIQTTDFMTAGQEIFGIFNNAEGELFAFAFDPSKHVKHLAFEPDAPLYLSFDFNVTPLTCIVAQHGYQTIHIIDEFRLMKSDIYRLCEAIKERYPDSDYYVTGDASGKNHSAMVGERNNYFTIIARQLGLYIQQHFNVPKTNPNHIPNRVLVNSILNRHPHFYISNQCTYLIEDLKTVRVTPEGKIDKARDPLKGHLLDCLRYYLNAFHGDFCRKWDDTE
jgi:hypothetical protein